MKLEIIIASTRPGRRGLPVAEWFADVAKGFQGFEVSISDLAKINLPLLDEPNEPNLQQYTKEHTKAWAEKINAADAFVFVMPEYNHNAPASLINALDYLYKEWNYKPVGFVSYGGISGGMRSVQSIKPLVTSLKMMPVYEAVNIINVKTLLDDEVFQATEQQVKSANTLLTELQRWATALKTMR
ncbi:MAG: NADPH-dependent reductase [Candidatus Saccharibacteria bacterium]|nr:NADPH-dependent reductase [Candidatus Saccharibacteria bacterium]